MSEAGLLRAMVRNYNRNNLWDHLDAEACTKAANKIDELTEKVIEQAAVLHLAKAALDVAFEYDGDVFGAHHNDATDALITINEVLNDH